ncbi:MAG TPA: hypothetical protein VIS29_22825, partial [Streptomyces sp.]
MHRSARLATHTAAAVAVVALGLAPSAYAGDADQLEVTPATAPPGATVTVSTTACGATGKGLGDASELDADDFEVRPGTGEDKAKGQFTVPQGTAPGTYTIGVSCDNGKEADRDLEVAAGPSGSPVAPAPSAPPASDWTAPDDDWAKPSTKSSTKPDATPEPTRPSGHVQTGVGGSVRPDTAQIATGAGVIAAAAISGG